MLHPRPLHQAQPLWLQMHRPLQWPMRSLLRWLNCGCQQAQHQALLPLQKSQLRSPLYRTQSSVCSPLPSLLVPRPWLLPLRLPLGLALALQQPLRAPAVALLLALAVSVLLWPVEASRPCLPWSRTSWLTTTTDPPCQPMHPQAAVLVGHPLQQQQQAAGPR